MDAISTIQESPPIKFEEEVVESMRAKLLSNIVIFNSIRLLHLRDSLGTTSIVIVVLTCLLYILATIISKLFDRTAPVLSPAALLASFLTAFSFGVMKILYDDILVPNAKNFASFFDDENGITVLRGWFRSFLSIRKQLLISVVCGLLGVFTLYLGKRYSAANFRVGSYILVFFCLFAVGHGAYCAIAVPTLAKAVSEERPKMFWLNPADSPWVKIASSSFSKLSMADTIILFLCVVGLFFLGPQSSLKLMIIAAIWLLVGFFTVSYSLLYPRYYLQKSIKAEKIRQMSEMQNLIASYRSHIEQLDENELKKLSELVKLYDHLALAKESTIDLGVLINLIPSIGIPLVTFILTLITLWKNLAEAVKNIHLP